MKIFYGFFILVFLLCAGICADDHRSCFTIVAGKAASADGSLLVGHNEDDRGPFFVNVYKIPSRELPKGDALLSGKGRLSPPLQQTIDILWLNIPGAEFADSLFNEHGVVITANACQSREDKGELTGNGIGNQLVRIVAERARSAREGVVIAGELIHSYGYSSSGRSYIIADPAEAWILHAVKGKHWVAQRVDDEEVAVIANSYTITAVNLNDTAVFMGSSDIIEYAQKRGWYNPEKDGAFDFARAYSDAKEYKDPGNILRQWRGTSILAEKEIAPEDPLPFSFKPHHKVHIPDLFRLLRDHYEGTEYDLSQNYKTGSPNSTRNRTICTESTQYSFVAHLRSWLPPEMGNLAWIAFRRPDTNAFSPWYFAITEPPKNFARGDGENAWKGQGNIPTPPGENSDEAFYNYNKLSELADRQYRERIDQVQKVWRNFENFAFKDLKNREKEFEYILKNHRTVALNLITNCVHFLEYRKWLLAADLLRELRK